MRSNHCLFSVKVVFQHSFSSANEVVDMLAEDGALNGGSDAASTM